MNVTSIALHQGNPECQDRAEIIPLGGRTLLVVADGAGGLSGGAQAADLFLRTVRESAPRLHTAEDCRQLLGEIDQQLAQAPECGETTGILVVMDISSIFGASVGDSAGWLFAPDRAEELTRGQCRKPFLGSGEAFAGGFTLGLTEGTVVVATDGLWKYTSLERIQQQVCSAAGADLATQLAELVRLRSGAFPDDVAVVTCRISS